MYNVHNVQSFNNRLSFGHAEDILRLLRYHSSSKIILDEIPIVYWRKIPLNKICECLRWKNYIQIEC